MLKTEEQISDVDASYSYMIRMKWQQLAFQTYFPRVLPRSKLLFVDAHQNLEAPEIDFPTVFERLTGISLEKYIAIGFGYYSGAIEHARIGRYFPSSGLLQQRISKDECELFLARTSAT